MLLPDFTMKTKSVIITFLLVLSLGVWPGSLRGQAPADTLALDLETALSMAFELNPTLAIAELGKQSREARYNEQRGMLLPSLNASGQYNRNIKKPVFFLPPGSPFGDVLEVGSDNSYTGALTATMPLYNPALIRSIRAARLERTIAGEEYRAARIELQHMLQTAFFDALLAGESLEVIRQSYANANENLENIRKLYSQGMVAEFDLIRAEVQTENLRPTLLQAENGYQLALNYLKAVIGLEETRQINITGNLADASENMLRQFTIQEAERSLRQNTDLVQLDLQMDLLEKQARAIRATGLPSVAAASNYLYQAEANDFRLGDYNWINTISAGIQVNIPIFRGLTIRNQARQVEIASHQLKLQRDYLEENLQIQLDNILRSMSVAVEKSTNAERNMHLAERGYAIARARYDSGQGTLLEVNDSEMALTQARFNYLQARHEILQSKAEYERFMGQYH
jgi:outer membrane protein